MSNRRWFTSLCVTLLLAGLQSASAASYSYSFPQPSYQVAPGDIVDVPIYLTETVGAGETSLLATEGMFFVSFDLWLDDGLPVAILDFSASPEWDAADFFENLPGIYTLNAYSSLTQATFGEPVPLQDGQYQLYLGDLQFLASGNPGESVIATVNVSPGGGAISFDTLELIEDIASADVTITIVPEPSSLASLTLLGAMLLRRRH